jgi:hypothetical protein
LAVALRRVRVARGVSFSIFAAIVQSTPPPNCTGCAAPVLVPVPSPRRAAIKMKNPAEAARAPVRRETDASGTAEPRMLWAMSRIDFVGPPGA